MPEIQALIRLLDDDDKEVFAQVHERLKSYGPSIIPELEKAWAEESDILTHTRLEELIREILLDDLFKHWENWLTSDQPDLLTGAYLVARYHYPELQWDDITKKINKIKQSIWLELNYNQTPLEQIHIFNQIFYDYHNFRGIQVSADYQDYCINNVLELRKGNAIGLGVLYQVLANELNLPVYGVTLARHFILSFCKRNIFDFSPMRNTESEVMFYINPINRGSIFSRNEINDYLQKAGVEPRRAYFAPAGVKSIVAELLSNLMEMYEQQHRYDRMNDMHKLLVKLQQTA
ncbi:MAG: transglutaminase-like domain-containing protein [Chitinophagales bacterium]|nr:transglutaminase-like domain-containing protein [Chitinophagales bacterium]MDW8418059.1 transglutaminase-like domain-containing protein [Chitinophagales bacterium]